MIIGLAWWLIAAAGVAVAWGLLTALVNKPPGKAQLLYAMFVELVVVVQSVIALVKLIAGFRPTETATTIGYLIAIVILMPVAFFWANNERTRFSGVVLAVAAGSVLAMTLRLLTLWMPAPR